MRIINITPAILLVGTLVAVADDAPEGRESSSLEQLERSLERPEQSSEHVDAVPPNGERGHLGLVADDLPAGEGVQVLSVRGGGPSDQAGLKPGDIVVAVDNNPVRQLGDMVELVGRTKPGDRVAVEVKRGGRRLVIEVNASRRFEQTPEASVVSRTYLGVMVGPVTEASRRNLGLVLRRGALIQQIVPGSPADQYGLPLGAVVVGLDGVRIDSPEDLIEQISLARPGQTIELTFYAGAELFRKRVRLAPKLELPPEEEAFQLPLEAPPIQLPPSAAESVPSSTLPAPAGTPSLQRLEKQLSDPLPVEAAAPDQLTTLRDEIERLRAQMELLQQQLDETAQQLAKLRDQITDSEQ